MLINKKITSEIETPPKVLLLEEKQDWQELLGDLFKRRGVFPVLASSFKEALGLVPLYPGHWNGLVFTWNSGDPEMKHKLSLIREKAVFFRTLALVASEREFSSVSVLYRQGLLDYFEIRPHDPEEIVSFMIGGYGDD